VINNEVINNEPEVQQPPIRGLPGRGCDAGGQRLDVWRKSTHSDYNGCCVEVALSWADASMRDSKNPNGAMLTFAADDWRDFVAGLKLGEFDLRG
jgi:hypothetical protein